MPRQDNTINDTSAVVLGLLHQEPLIGGHLVELAEKWMPYFSITRSQVYRDLIAMEKRSLVREVGTGPRGSMTYRITPAGKRAFQAWAKQPISLDSIRNSMALRVAFTELVGPETIQGMTDELLKQHNIAKLRIQGLMDEAKHNDLDGDWKALAFALEYHLMSIQWIENWVTREAKGTGRVVAASKAAPAKS